MLVWSFFEIRKRIKKDFKNRFNSDTGVFGDNTIFGCATEANTYKFQNNIK